jgi:hypothetical protein
MKNYFALIVLLLLGLCYNEIYGRNQQEKVKHVKVYYEPGMYGGWPANNGIWIWENEILVGFTKGFYKDLGPERHNMDREKPELHLLARSLDGGETWSIEDPGKTGNMVKHGIFMAVPRTDIPIQSPVECKEKINFKHPDFALTATTNDVRRGESRYWYSYDRGRNWKGPYVLPDFGTAGTAARTDYIVNSNDDCMLFMTAAKSNGDQGRAMLAKTSDGGIEWSFVSWIGPEEKGFSIMPASVRLSEKEILVTVRRREGDHRFISAYLSEDNGLTWSYLNDPAPSAGAGNPPAMLKMQDGRICLIYGYRAAEADVTKGIDTSDIRAKISSDNGRTWSDDYILRSDGSGQDIGYPRVVQRPDGKIVAVYYFMDRQTGPERYIGATIWTPPAP